MRLPMIRLAAMCWLAAGQVAMPMQIVGHDSDVNDRFASGFQSNPVRNNHPNFIGKDFDWTSAGWNAGSPRVGYGFLSPRHHLLAKHFTSQNNRRIFGNDDVVHTVGHQETVDLGLGFDLEGDPDLSISRLVRAMPDSAAMPRVPVLDLNNGSTSNSPNSYNNRSVFLYGHWGDSSNVSPRIAQTTMSSTTASGTDHSFETSRTLVQLQGNDSGSPAYMVWTDPDGGQELALIGNHAAINATANFHNFAGSHQVMAGLNAVMTADGYALRVEGESQNTWVGSTRNSIGDRRSWGIGLLGQAPSDRFVTFDGSTAGSGRVVDVASNHNLRGLYFRNTGGSSAGFVFSGSSVLTIGRGGVNNLDASLQVFDATIALGDHQFWDAGAGGVSLNAIQTGGHLLSIRSAGASSVRGPVTGAGGIALESGMLHLEADTTHTGMTWVHSGQLRVDGDIRTSERAMVGPGGVLAGHGKLPVAESGGSIEPDGILSAESLGPVEAARFHFRFAGASPGYGNVATSPNDVLRLTAATPLSTALTSTNVVSIYLGEEPDEAGVVMRGGIFFDNAAADTTLVSGALYQVFVADAGGSVSHGGQSYSPLDGRDWSISYAPETADFAEGSVNGLVMLLDVAAITGTYAAWAAEVFPENTPEADTAPDAAPFGDGVPNLLAYALALDPLGNKAGGLPTGDHEDGALVFRLRRNVDALDVAFTIEASEDLVGWSIIATAPTVIDPDVDGDGRAELLEVAIPAGAQETRRFARLGVAFAE